MRGNIGVGVTRKENSMDDRETTLFGVIAAVIFLISTIVCICVFGFEGAAVRFIISALMLAVASLGGIPGASIGAGVLIFGSLIIDGFNDLGPGIASASFSGVISVIALLLLCFYLEGDSPACSTCKLPQRTIKVELVDKRRRKRRRQRRRGSANSL